MVEQLNTSHRSRLSRDDWLQAALESIRHAGIDGVKVAPLADRLGVTTGSFYWHFKNRRELLDMVLDYWERAVTDQAMQESWQFRVSAKKRILFLMQRVMEGDLAGFDLPIWLWAQSDADADEVFQRTLKKRFDFVTTLFREAGFSRRDAEHRAQMTVVYMMGESTLVRRSSSVSPEAIRAKHAILTARS